MNNWLVDEWRQAWKWLSVQLTAALGVLTVIYEVVPAAQDYLPTRVFHFLMIAGLIGVIVGRLKNQQK